MCKIFWYIDFDFIFLILKIIMGSVLLIKIYVIIIVCILGYKYGWLDVFN